LRIREDKEFLAKRRGEGKRPPNRCRESAEFERVDVLSAKLPPRRRNHRPGALTIIIKITGDKRGGHHSETSGGRINSNCTRKPYILKGTLQQRSKIGKSGKLAPDGRPQNIIREPRLLDEGIDGGKD
jgi:hypothetical protein